MNEYIAENLLRDYSEYISESIYSLDALNKLLKDLNLPSEYSSEKEAREAIIDYYNSKKNEKDPFYTKVNPAIFVRNSNLAATAVSEWLRKGSVDSNKTTNDKDKIDKLSYDKRETEDDDTTIDKEYFPKYEEFRKKWYDKTVSMGWPDDIKYPKQMGIIDKTQTKDGKTYPWSSSKLTSFVFGSDFNNSMWTSVTKEIKNKLYNKFKNNIRGLKNLQAQIEKIVTAEEQYLKEVKSKTSKTGKALSLATGFGKLLVSNIFYGIGGKESDLTMFKYLFGNKNKMTFFQYQLMIIEQMLVLMEVDDNTTSVLKDKLAALRKILEDDFKTNKKSSLVLTPTKFEYKLSNLIATFDVKSKDPKTGADKAQQYDPFFSTVDVLLSVSDEQKIDEMPNKEQYEKIKEVIKQKNLEGTAIGKLLVAKNSKTISFVQYAKEGNVVKGKYIFEVTYMVNFCTVTFRYETSEDDE